MGARRGGRRPQIGPGSLPIHRGIRARRALWDIGTFDTIEGNYWAGDLRIYLTGKKLKGEWHLRRASDDQEKQVWTIEKTGETAPSITAKADDKSALTGRTMAQIAADRDKVWASAREGGEPSHEAAETRSKAPRAKARKPTPAAPEFSPVMQAKLVTELPVGDEWIYELKWDGYRAEGMKHGATTRVISRKETDMTAQFPGIAAALTEIRAECALIDGEIVALDPSGKPWFQMLQNRRSDAAAIVFYAFDLLNLDGVDWRDRPLEERKAKLAEIIRGSAIKFSRSFDGDPAPLVAQLKRWGLEGVVAKRRRSRYEEGERSGAWVKFKMDGFGFLQWIKAQAEFKDLKVVVLSSSNDIGDRERAAELGAHAYTVKFPEASVLVQLVTGSFPHRGEKRPA